MVCRSQNGKKQIFGIGWVMNMVVWKKEDFSVNIGEIRLPFHRNEEFRCPPPRYKYLVFRQEEDRKRKKTKSERKKENALDLSQPWYPATVTQISSGSCVLASNPELDPIRSSGPTVLSFLLAKLPPPAAPGPRG